MIASVLLGSHPPVMAVKSLVRVGELFGIAEGTVRVALSRLTADGELVTDNGHYRLGARLAARQADQDQERWPRIVDWPDTWEIVVAPVAVAERDGLGATLQARHLAPAGARTWMRPANLERPPSLFWPAGCRRFEGRPLEVAGDADGHGTRSGDVPDDRTLVASLWDLDGWERRGEGLLATYTDAGDPAERFVVAAAILRHLRTDPLLPERLISEDWPAGRLRATYERFTEELQDLLAASVAPR